MTRTIAVASQKGGVGKTTSTMNLSAAFAETGARVLLIDLDPQGALTAGMGVSHQDLKRTVYNALTTSLPMSAVLKHVRDYVDLLPATIDLAGAEAELMAEVSREHILRGKLKEFKDRYEWILIDCPPSLGLLTINALTAADGVLIPVQCQYLSFRGMQLLLQLVKKIQERANEQLTVAGLLPTMFDSRITHDKEVLEELRTTYPQWLIDIPISRRAAVADAIVAGQSILDFRGNSDVSKSYRRVAEVLANGA
ncbi:MAG: ParA family protein [Gemmatimonadaceae bacterium]